MKAFVLCGGKGTRLRPHTYTIPKPMLTLGKRPILEFVIGNLRNAGIKDLVLTVGYLKDQIMDYFGDGKRFGVKITYSQEEEEMNTAGSILPMKDQVGSRFVVVMGDHLTLVDLRKMINHHRKEGQIATMGLKLQGLPLEYGVAYIDDNGHICGFKEKPILKNYVNAGVYVFEPEIFEYISPKDDFARNVFPRLLRKGKKIAAYPFEEYWVDIGRLSDYEALDQHISITELVLSHEKGFNKP